MTQKKVPTMIGCTHKPGMLRFVSLLALILFVSVARAGNIDVSTIPQRRACN